MKELSIEQKAQRYDEAIARASEMIKAMTNIGGVAKVDDIQYIFPELKESEDEKIRDADKKELKEIKKKPKKCMYSKDDYTDEDRLVLCDGCDEICELKQKTAWSEKDEERINSILFGISYTYSNGHYPKDTYQKDINWLKSLKDRVQLQNITYYNPYKEVVESIAEMCKHYDKASHNGLRDFYDNVKVKCKDAKEYDSLYPQNTWKPSDEQMDTLKFACGGNYVNLGILESLYQDLKKLK